MNLFEICLGLDSLFNDISVFMGYLMPKPFRRRAVALFNPQKGG